MVAAQRRPPGCVRALLVALQCAKGEVDQNLARHLGILELARERHCDIALFPEMSLTGSLHPIRQADRALTLDAPPVRALAKATAIHGVAALFGVAERGASGPHITQVLAAGGRLRGSYRKRHLGEDEEGFVRGDQQSPLRWTCKSTRHLAEELNAAKAGRAVSDHLVRDLLHDKGYSLHN